MLPKSVLYLFGLRMEWSFLWIKQYRICSSLRLQDRFVFQFAGNLGYAQGIDNLLEAIGLIKNDNIHFLFIGDGAKAGDIVSYMKKGTHKNVSLLGFRIVRIRMIS